MSEILSVRETENIADRQAITELIREYAQNALGDDYHICRAGIEQELLDFPGAYAPPAGLALLAYIDKKPCGCLALRPLTATSGEVMRMYVRPTARRHGIAEMMMRQLIEKAKNIGYNDLYLFSLKRFAAAHKLYKKLGFSYCEAYSPDITDAMRDNMAFMRLTLK